MLAVYVTTHAIERYGERVKPGLGPEALEAEVLAVLANCAEVVYERPAWVNESEGSDQDVAYALVGDGICFCLARWSSTAPLAAVTCLTRAAMSDEARERRNERAARRRKSRAARRRKNYVPRPVTRPA